MESSLIFCYVLCYDILTMPHYCLILKVKNLLCESSLKFQVRKKAVIVCILVRPVAYLIVDDS
jgi:hypothetical protein